MTTTLSHLPFDIIWKIGEFLDYNTVQTLNRVLDFEERLVKKIPTKKIIEHELYVWNQRIEYDMKRIESYRGNNYYHKICKLLNVFDKLKKKSRGYILLEYSGPIRRSMREMCTNILESSRAEYTRDVPAETYKILKDSAAELLHDVERITSKFLTPNVTSAVIYPLTMR